jgi:transposase
MADVPASIILNDNGSAHTAETLSKISFAAGDGILEYPPYSPDMSPHDYDLFVKMK